MNPSNALGHLATKWRDYLIERGHYVYRTKPDLGVVRSRNSNKVRYRWLLIVSGRAIRRLSKSEQAYIRWHIREAETREEAAYLVVGFTQEPRRIIVLPANAALKAQCVRSDKGGIAWYD